jgi:amidase
MSFEFPTPEDLKTLGRAIDFALDDAGARALCGFMTPLLAGYEWLDAQSDELPPVKYPERSYEFPQAGDNPLGAWYVRTRIKGAASGPLAGRTVAIKDNILVAGVPMMNGAKMLEGFVPDVDATVVTRLLDAGAEIAGKAVCEYFCVSGGSFTAGTGIVDNPYRRGYSAGGSSSGSGALVGGRHVDIALGCDQAGSIRLPASWCGCCGMKATFGLIPYTGIMGMETSIDNVGPMTRGVADNALVLEVLAGDDGYDGRQQQLELHRYTEALGRDLKGMRIGLVKEGFGQPRSEALVDDCVRAAAARLERLGAHVKEVSIPEQLNGVAIWGGIIGDGLYQTLKLNGLGYNYKGVYSPAQFRAMDGWLSRLAETPPNVRVLVMLGAWLARYRGRYYAKAKNLARRLRAAYDAAFESFDLLLMPTTQLRAQRNPPSFAEAPDATIIEHAFGNIGNTCHFDVTGHPAMSIPCGLREGLPVGLMLIARHFDEPSIYRAAHAFEQSGNWEEM